ncbi:MAG: Holliday junction resolvase RuvX, partial [Leeuwenhoekiella sp.]
VKTDELLVFLREYCEKENVERIIVGEPKRMNNEASAVEEHISRFCKKLEQTIPIPISRVDERFTSKMAAKSMLESGHKKKKRRDKALIDEISATIILQTYLYN